MGLAFQHACAIATHTNHKHYSAVYTETNIINAEFLLLICVICSKANKYVPQRVYRIQENNTEKVEEHNNAHLQGDLTS